MDFYAKATNGLTGGSEKKVVFDSTNNYSKCYIPFDDITTATPVIAVSGDVVTNFSTDIQSGFSTQATRGLDDDGKAFFIADNIDLSGQADNVIVGYTFDYEVKLPQVHYQIQGTAADYSAVLNVSRMKFSVGRSSTLGFKLSYNGYRGQVHDFTDMTNGVYKGPFTLPDNIVESLKDKSDIKISVNGRNRTDFTITEAGVITITGTAPPASDPNNPTITMLAYEDTWYDLQAVQEANLYLADDVAILGEAVYTVPIHQRSGNFSLKVFSDSPFPVSLTSMMWEGNYSARYYRRN